VRVAITRSTSGCWFAVCRSPLLAQVAVRFPTLSGVSRQRATARASVSRLLAEELRPAAIWRSAAAACTNDVKMRR
jgi:hypothetical protein